MSVEQLGYQIVALALAMSWVFVVIGGGLWATSLFVDRYGLSHSFAVYLGVCLVEVLVTGVVLVILG